MVSTPEIILPKPPFSEQDLLYWDTEKLMKALSIASPAKDGLFLDTSTFIGLCPIPARNIVRYMHEPGIDWCAKLLRRNAFFNGELGIIYLAQTQEDSRYLGANMRALPDTRSFNNNPLSLCIPDTDNDIMQALIALFKYHCGVKAGTGDLANWRDYGELCNMQDCGFNHLLRETIWKHQQPSQNTTPSLQFLPKLP